MNAKQIAMALAIAIGVVATNEVQAQYDYGAGAYGGVPLQQKLFQNQYTQPGASQVNAALYVAPQPVPARVGHTYYTYEALYPHEHLYSHRRTYYNYYAGPEAFYGDACKRRPTGGGALNKTTVVWQSGCNHYGTFPFNYTALQNLQYKLLSKRYCLGATCGGKWWGLGGGGCASGNCN